MLRGSDIPRTDTPPIIRRLDSAVMGAALGLVLSESVTIGLDHLVAQGTHAPFSAVRYWLGGLATGGLTGLVLFDSESQNSLFQLAYVGTIGLFGIANMIESKSCDLIHSAVPGSISSLGVIGLVGSYVLFIR